MRRIRHRAPDGSSRTTIVDDSAIAAPPVAASAFAVFDVQASTMLATANADVRLSVGSLMKLLNAVVAYDAGHQDKAIVAPDGLAGTEGESVIGIAAGQVLSRSSLIRAMLKVSANDAARLLATDIAGSEEAYATMMNDAAASFKCLPAERATVHGERGGPACSIGHVS